MGSLPDKESESEGLKKGRAQPIYNSVRTRESTVTLGFCFCFVLFFETSDNFSYLLFLLLHLKKKI